MLTALLRWMDPGQLFAVLLDHKATAPSNDLPLARPLAIPDQVLLKKLIPADLYQSAMQAGWMGMHALSFALRYRVAELQLLFHLNYPEVDHILRQELLESWQHTQGQECLPIFGFSPLGIHVSARARGICRAFDAISIWSCAVATDSIFCEAHKAEAFWTPADTGTQQAIMFRYYADQKNFSLYGEADLRQMMGAFWKRYQSFATEDLDEALERFGLQDTQDLRAFGTTELRRRFLQLSMIHHPDRGGAEEDFVRLQRHYQRLKLYLEAT